MPFRDPLPHFVRPPLLHLAAALLLLAPATVAQAQSSQPSLSRAEARALAKRRDAQRAELDNAYLVRELYEAWNRGDHATLLAGLHPEVRWAESQALPFGGNFRGPDAVQEKLLHALDRDWQGFTIALEAVFTNGNLVLAQGSVTGFNRATGQLLESPYSAVWQLRDGEVRAYNGFFNNSAVLRAYRDPLAPVAAPRTPGSAPPQP